MLKSKGQKRELYSYLGGCKCYQKRNFKKWELHWLLTNAPETLKTDLREKDREADIQRNEYEAQLVKATSEAEKLKETERDLNLASSDEHHAQ